MRLKNKRSQQHKRGPKRPTLILDSRVVAFGMGYTHAIPFYDPSQESNRAG
jgi:hypothetical protein